MFAASNGGYTRPSPDANMPFPAVVDEGDDTSANPNYRWTTSLDGATIAARYGFTSLTSLSITSTSGPVGDTFGGWVTGPINLVLLGVANGSFESTHRACPPSTASVCPVTQLAMSLTRKRAAWATSSGRP